MQAVRWRTTWLVPLILILLPTGIASASEKNLQWPEWERFSERFIQADGRVIDLTFDGKSTSEGQSYGLFFALVANRRAQFDTILNWTSANLADAQLGEKLPGWLWGKHDDGSWSIKDRNAASDADLWIAYSLLEAGRLWGEPRYEALGRKLLALIDDQEVVAAGAVGKLLLPGPMGFKLQHNRFRINPSYLPGFMFEYLSMADPAGPWSEIWKTYVRLAPKIYASGVAPDIVVVDSTGAVLHDTERAPAGSYDAIRVYLWAGMSSGQENKKHLRSLAPYAKLMHDTGTPPEKVSPINGAVLKADYSPIGFSGAVLPFLAALDDQKLLKQQLDRLRLDALQAKLGRTTHYYDQMLILFGKGWQDGYYRFDAQGRLQTKWSQER